MWESTKTKAYCLTCGEKIEDDVHNDKMTNMMIEMHLDKNPDHICVKGKIYGKCNHDEEIKDSLI